MNRRLLVPPAGEQAHRQPANRSGEVPALPGSRLKAV